MRYKMYYEDSRTRIDELTAQLESIQNVKKNSITFMRQLYTMGEPFTAQFWAEGEGKIKISFTLPPMPETFFYINLSLDGAVLANELIIPESKAYAYSFDVTLKRGNHSLTLSFNNPYTARTLTVVIEAQAVKKIEGIVHLDYASSGGREVYLAEYENTCSLYDRDFVNYENIAGMETLARPFFTQYLSKPLFHLFYIDNENTLRVYAENTFTPAEIAKSVRHFALLPNKERSGGFVYYITDNRLCCCSFTYDGAYSMHCEEILRPYPYLLTSVHIAASSDSAYLYLQLVGGGNLYLLSPSSPFTLTFLSTVPPEQSLQTVPGQTPQAASEQTSQDPLTQTLCNTLIQEPQVVSEQTLQTVPGQTPQDTLAVPTKICADSSSSAVPAPSFPSSRAPYKSTGIYLESQNLSIYYKSSGTIRCFSYNLSDLSYSTEDISAAEAFIRISPSRSLVLKNGLLFLSD